MSLAKLLVEQPLREKGGPTAQERFDYGATLELTKKYPLLQLDEYNDVRDPVAPLLDGLLE